MSKKSKKSKDKKSKKPKLPKIANLIAEESAKAEPGILKAPTAEKTKTFAVGDMQEDETYGNKTTYETLSNHVGFDVVRKKSYDYHGKLAMDNQAIRILDEKVLEFLADESRDSHYYGELPLVMDVGIMMSEMIEFREEFDNASKRIAEGDEDYYRINTSGIKDLLDYLFDLDQSRRDMYQRMLDQGDVTFDNLDLYFTKNSRIVFQNGEELEGGLVISTRIQITYFGPVYAIEYAQYTSDGQKFGKKVDSMSIDLFTGKAAINDLPCRLITSAEEGKLTRRGKAWSEAVHKPNYLHFSGKMFIKAGWFGDVPVNATGRCMIDLAMFRQENSGDRMSRNMEVIEDGKQMPDDMLFTTPSVGYGFSLNTKRWGKFPISGLSNIDYRDDAYDLLVLDKDVKREVRALVENSEEMFTDLISGKGGGAIFLLHGPPGVGKTLTAESVAEILHRPLYSVSVGELGVTPGEVEASLRSILEMVTSWNAVLLLDEADIFLEARTKDDITRNAMVGVFLRLLEYHNGVLFLTTNRVQNFDDAFMSRISVIIQYEEFDPETRKTVWDNILFSAGLAEAGIDTEYMAVQYDVNGRQIKNAIRIAMSLAHSDGVPCDQTYVERVVARNVRVIDDIKKIDPTTGTAGQPVESFAVAS